jgi:hypothetical protein
MWAWYGLQPINKLTRRRHGLVTSMQAPEALRATATARARLELAIVKSLASFRLWCTRTTTQTFSTGRRRPPRAEGRWPQAVKAAIQAE